MAISEGEPVYSTSISDDRRCTLAECKQAGMHSFAALPLFKGTNTLGVLGIASTRERDFSRQAAFLQAVAAEVAIGLQNALLHQQVQGHVSELEKEVTQRKKAEDALRMSEERFRNIFEHSPIGIYQTTPDGRILMANPTLVRILGYASFRLAASFQRAGQAAGAHTAREYRVPAICLTLCHRRCRFYRP